MLGGPMERPPLMLADLSTVRFIADVGESDISLMREGLSASLIVSSSNKTIPVTIERINQAVDPIVNTIQIEGTFSNQEHALRHGQSCELSIVLPQKQSISVARSALIDRKDGSAKVFVVTTNDTIQLKEVQYGRSDTGKVPIVSGLNIGDQILISGHTRLSDGDSVQVIGKE